MNLPNTLAQHLSPLFDALSLDESMAHLVVQMPHSAKVTSIVEELIDGQHVGEQSPLAAGLWLYVDELDRSHEVSQSLPDATGSFWHGIMHRREGDFGNSHYWFQRTGHHPAIEDVAGYEPHDFIDAVQSHFRTPPNELVTIQRAEWTALFAWCAHNCV